VGSAEDAGRACEKHARLSGNPSMRKHGLRLREARHGEQDLFISQQLSLWNQRGSQVIRGNLLVVPIERSLVYV
jgi:hypothetical protein